MLAEALEHWRTPAPKWVKVMGYVREQVALEYRHRRCTKAWAPHLEKTRNLIRTAIAGCDTKRHCVVLGSGHLLDIPLDEIATAFERVDLVDLAHPRAVRSDVRQYNNVHLVDADVSGAARALYEFGQPADPANTAFPKLPSLTKVCRVIDTDAPNIDLPTPEPDKSLIEGADLVISANILSQLPLLLLERLQKHASWVEPDMRQAFARAVVDHHLAFLQNHTGQVCLITEVLRFVHDNGKPLEKIDPLFGTAVMLEGEEWWWDIAPRPELGPDFDVRLSVLGVPDMANAPQARYCRNTTLAAP